MLLLEGQPDRLWSSERKELMLAKAPDALTWSDFEAFLKNNLGKLAPMTDYFKKHENPKQESTVIDYVSRLKTCVSKLKNTFLEPSEGTVGARIFYDERCVYLRKGEKMHTLFEQNENLPPPPPRPGPVTLLSAVQTAKI